MPETPKILVFAGSTREDSFNKKLAKSAAAAAEKAGADVAYLDLKEFPLPLYDGDLEQREGLPDNAKALKAKFKESHGLIIASPEYNSSITAVLKNTIDWVSRPEEGEPSLAAFTGKVAGIISASPGALGGLRGLVHLRAILSNIHVLVIPDQLAVGQASQAFKDDDTLADEKKQARLAEISAKVVRVAGRLVE